MVYWTYKPPPEYMDSVQVGMEGYQPDLAYIHDTGFTGFARKAAPGIIALLRRNSIRRGLVIDAGCGSGVFARELTDKGYDVLGIDISPAMIRLARRHAPRAKFLTRSFLKADLPPCDAVTAIGECVNYAFDRESGKKALIRFFRQVYLSLRPGGVFIFDMVEPGVTGPTAEQRKYVEGPDWAILLEVLEDRKRRLLTRRITSFRRTGKLYRRAEEVHRLHLYPHADLLRELNRAGFEARTLDGYGRFRLAPAHAVFLARKAMKAIPFPKLRRAPRN
jgi:SAM-dependent methyltransferase